MRHALRQLHYLSVAAQVGSFRRTAEMCQVDQSNVGRALKQLEDHLGISLFERARSGVRLTPAGRQFLADVSPALELLESARRSARGIRRAESGLVRIGILTSLAGGFLRQLVETYAERHPRVTIDVRDGGRREHLAAVRARRLDAAIITGAEPVPGCETRELWRERVYVALPESHPLAARPKLDWPDLKAEHFIVSRGEPGPEVHDYIVRRSADYSTYPDVEEKVALQDTLMNLVSLGQGITLVSAAWTAVKVPELVLRPLTARADIVPFSVVWSSANDNPAFLRFLQTAQLLASTNCGRGAAVRNGSGLASRCLA
ncbi:MAG: LysR family transcriptional regulator [Mesorhizobium sp.]|uniref:LysR family transcriptional regulator n=1 Tax=Mesorhizobium sp. TaxID=1871066 RepID=UPI000FE48286|nr:LysR family transcriptional regulator [Mesorhizobium sp.]RWH82182.1 MAG: LysR family transcriptional regulator [Mesorhizobium sp.]RWH85183.1 MAG: LysR family transcriptional regulator [Mesorhizobium sp.]RWH89938.1 MAG: LysR family transcriptional regulator [Mesorhizobium sp.]RWH98312.1 MAG: LysR family transcriptional regulator [Mesorhizobium sp.]RWI04680.1 MAG: LysR family transcriptional regulator [Mesorhizobium sp.]